ncbi:rifin PIR protein, putative [Plasmodium reichenowi]|uniref:Rifin PIR protein, putative n=1 Tax=Plasmodium reichenowi TaxID=5854 RepID=A0A2P9DSC0_PLARE|nr:rifin PIR protein, putative [Plasmodium reichenowi]
MKLHYSKILVCILPLTIFVTSSSNENTHKKLHTTPHHTQTNRSLCECDTQSSIYDKDAEMKSVKENFHRQTSQRFEEYKERMKEKRQKRKEQRDKNIQEIIDKDKMDKSLAEKIEKGCLRCGCALGGGILPVWGLVSGLWYATWSQYLSAKALPVGIKKGIEVGITEIFKIWGKTVRLREIPITVEEMLSSGKFTKSVNLFDMAQHISDTMYEKFLGTDYHSFWMFVDGIVKCETIDMFNKENSTHIAAVANAVAKGKAAEAANYASTTSSLTTGITASIIAIVVIVLVLIIIYLVLLYRRKKKMKKKAQYKKLLNE